MASGPRSHPPHRARVPASLVADYELRPAAEPKRLFLLLHGYMQNGAYLFRKLEASLPASAVVLSPNAPFPIPEKTPEGYRVGFTWYFYNPDTDEYFIDMEIALEFLGGLVEQLGFGALPKTIIGFSQGGYLAPFAAQRLGADHVIGIASQYLKDELQRPVRFRADSIHGENDEIVGAQGARDAHAALTSEGTPGEFHLIAGLGHRIDGNVQARVRELSALRSLERS